jgi:hypothetical protein
MPPSRQCDFAQVTFKRRLKKLVLQFECNSRRRGYRIGRPNSHVRRMENLGLVRIDDAVILRRAKELCQEAGTAWDQLSAFMPGIRVLNDSDRREYLMRARDQLVKEADNTGAPQSDKRLDGVIDAAIEATRIATVAETEEREALRATGAAAELERWREKVRAAS